MFETHASRDWLEGVAEFEAPTYEEVQLEIDMMSHGCGMSRRESAVDGDWADIRFE